VANFRHFTKNIFKKEYSISNSLFFGKEKIAFLPPPKNKKECQVKSE
jgi:hypothetical protein